MTVKKVSQDAHSTSQEEETEQLKHIVTELQILVTNLKFGLNKKEEELSATLKEVIKQDGIIRELKSICFQKDMQISFLNGKIVAKTDEQRRVFEQDNPVVQVSRSQLGSSLGYAEEVYSSSSRYSDWLNIEQEQKTRPSSEYPRRNF